MSNALHRPYEDPKSDPSVLLARLREAFPSLCSAAEEADSRAEVTSATWLMLQRTGVLQAPLPVLEGGGDIMAAPQTGALFDVLRLLGAADLSLARLVEGHCNAVDLVLRYGNIAQGQSLATAVRDGALTGVWGADGARPLRAERVGSSIRLRGDKVLASGAGILERPLVTAASPDGPLLLMLRLSRGERSDISGWTAQGMRSTATGTVDLDGMVLGAEHVIGEPGDFLRQPQLSGGAWRFCAAHLGAAERLTDLFRDHLISRKRDGDPYQVQRVAACVTATTTARFWVRRAADLLAVPRGQTPGEVLAFANLTRGVTERAALDVLDAVHRGVGLGGFVRPHPIERISRDLATYLRQPVPDLAMADAGRAVLASDEPVGSLWERP